MGMNKIHIDNFLKEAASLVRNDKIIIYGGAACVLHGIREFTKDIDCKVVSNNKDLIPALMALAEKHHISLCCDIVQYPEKEEYIAYDTLQNIQYLSLDMLLASKVMSKRHPEYANDADDVLNILIQQQYTYDEALSIAKDFYGTKIKPANESWLEMITFSSKYTKSMPVHPQ